MSLVHEPPSSLRTTTIRTHVFRGATPSAEYAPDVQDFRNYRLKSQANWEIVIDAEDNLSLKIGVLDRYDSLLSGAPFFALAFGLMAQ